MESRHKDTAKHNPENIIIMNQESATLLAPSLNNCLSFIKEPQTRHSQPTATHVLTAFHIAATIHAVQQ